MVIVSRVSNGLRSTPELHILVALVSCVSPDRWSRLDFVGVQEVWSGPLARKQPDWLAAPRAPLLLSASSRPRHMSHLIDPGRSHQRSVGRSVAGRAIDCALEPVSSSQNTNERSSAVSRAADTRPHRRQRCLPFTPGSSMTRWWRAGRARARGAGTRPVGCGRRRCGCRSSRGRRRGSHRRCVLHPWRR